MLSDGTMALETNANEGENKRPSWAFIFKNAPEGRSFLVLWINIVGGYGFFGGGGGPHARCGGRWAQTAPPRPHAGRRE